MRRRSKSLCRWLLIAAGLSLFVAAVKLRLVHWIGAASINQEHELSINRTPPLIVPATGQSPQPPATTAAMEELDRKDLRLRVARRNEGLRVLNREKFPLNESATIILVQVHDRVDYLRSLIKSLGEAGSIEGALLIFSHDFVSEEINSLIAQIDFCCAIQIFYPKSLQLYPNEFPGQHPNDCPKDLPKEDARKQNCTNAETPDMYKHYRTAAITQIKHHWWWKLNFVLGRIVPKFGMKGQILLLEEDHLVASDFLHVFHKISHNLPSVCPNCAVITLGGYQKMSHAAAVSDANKLFTNQWISNQHNMAMAMSVAAWRSVIDQCAQAFCTYDDYNWDWTLMQLNLHCLPGPWTAIMPNVPRVFHIGSCGTHQKKCTEAQRVAAETTVQDLLKVAKPSLFPNEMEKPQPRPVKLPRMKPNGGWADPRDHRLCLEMTFRSFNRTTGR